MQGYTGQKQEASLNLYDYNARWYDPTLGRFTQPDTIIPDPASAKSYDRYAYVENNPINFSDPSGHMPCFNRDGAFLGDYYYYQDCWDLKGQVVTAGMSSLNLSSAYHIGLFLTSLSMESAKNSRDMQLLDDALTMGRVTEEVAITILDILRSLGIRSEISGKISDEWGVTIQTNPLANAEALGELGQGVAKISVIALEQAKAILDDKNTELGFIRQAVMDAREFGVPMSIEYSWLAVEDGLHADRVITEAYLSIGGSRMPIPMSIVNRTSNMLLVGGRLEPGKGIIISPYCPKNPNEPHFRPGKTGMSSN